MNEILYEVFFTSFNNLKYLKSLEWQKSRHFVFQSSFESWLRFQKSKNTQNIAIFINSLVKSTEQRKTKSEKKSILNPFFKSWTEEWKQLYFFISNILNNENPHRKKALEKKSWFQKSSHTQKIFFHHQYKHREKFPWWGFSFFTGKFFHMYYNIFHLIFSQWKYFFFLLWNEKNLNFL